MASSEKKHAAWVDVVAGGFGGALAKSLLSPFQRIVVLQQLGQHKNHSINQLVRHIYAHDGLKSFWRGNLTSVIIRVPYSGIQFLLYTQLKFLFQDWLDRRNSTAALSGHGAKGDNDNDAGRESGAVTSKEVMEKFIMKCGAGGLSATIAGAAVYPGEVVRLRLMSGEKKFTGIAHTCRLVYRETHSLRNFYRGLGASLMQRVPDILISFATYETVKYAILDSPTLPFFTENYAARNVLSTVVGGSAAAIASIAVAFPLDVAKRRIGMSGQGTDKTVYRGVGDCLKRIYAKEGIRGCYAGALVEAVRCVPQVILMWMFIETIQRELSPYGRVSSTTKEAATVKAAP
ncbi:hypothetical protein JKF63_05821 [Porcisia hertigi]|uniref:Mitochondrial carrier protein n=1 Tax=Porcisia hertigi TaxID=2761500 RepID=A0A836IL90_9TRYP|nr:hypothetical protein JKF63_05821 [Porcisia hertigi]